MEWRWFALDYSWALFYLDFSISRRREIWIWVIMGQFHQKRMKLMMSYYFLQIGRMTSIDPKAISQRWGVAFYFEFDRVIFSQHKQQFALLGLSSRRQLSNIFWIGVSSLGPKILRRYLRVFFILRYFLYFGDKKARSTFALRTFPSWLLLTGYCGDNNSCFQRVIPKPAILEMFNFQEILHLRVYGATRWKKSGRTQVRGLWKV